MGPPLSACGLWRLVSHLALWRRCSTLQQLWQRIGNASVRELRRRGGFDVTCQGTVPAAAAAFLESRDFEDAVRNAVSLGGDADTLACIAGAMAEAFYGGVPADIQQEVVRRLDDALRTEIFAFARIYRVPLAVDTQEGGTC